MSGPRVAHPFLAVLLLWGVSGWADAGRPVPSRPEELRFSELRLPVPDATKLRHRLQDGVVVYVAEDHTLPLVDVVLAITSGDADDPPDKAGLDPSPAP